MATSPKKKPAAKVSKKGSEETLWDSANELCGSVESSEYNSDSPSFLRKRESTAR